MVEGLFMREKGEGDRGQGERGKGGRGQGAGGRGKGERETGGKGGFRDLVWDSVGGKAEVFRKSRLIGLKPLILCSQN